LSVAMLYTRVSVGERRRSPPCGEAILDRAMASS
jgi:hypothetical protein